VTLATVPACEQPVSDIGILSSLTAAATLKALRAAAEPTRLRLLLLLAQGELNVKDLTRILGQSQPRISRHLKLLADAQLIERFREGSWVYFHLADTMVAQHVLRPMLAALGREDPVLARDRARAEAVRRERVEAGQTWFRSHAALWDKIRSLHVAEDAVEAAIRSALGAGPFDVLLDLGTGTGRMLELFAPCVRRGLGVDLNHAMLSYARTKLDAPGLSHCQVRAGDIYNLALLDGTADAAIMHQVLHFLSAPARAIREAARVLAPGGRLLIVDFAPHDLEFLRSEFAHERLGFARAQVAQWLGEAGLQLTHQQDLPPPADAGGDQLTVSLWLGEAPAATPVTRAPTTAAKPEFAK